MLFQEEIVYFFENVITGRDREIIVDYDAEYYARHPFKISTMTR
jgi:hypothetical protein